MMNRVKGHIDKLDYHLTFKKKEKLSYTTTWMNLESMVLCKIRQSHKDRYYTIAHK